MSCEEFSRCSSATGTAFECARGWQRVGESSLLATELRSGIKRLCEIYGVRMKQEEAFRDLKSHRFGAALRYLKPSGADRYDRILAIWALAPGSSMPRVTPPSERTSAYSLRDLCGDASARLSLHERPAAAGHGG